MRVRTAGVARERREHQTRGPRRVRARSRTRRLADDGGHSAAHLFRCAVGRDSAERPQPPPPGARRVESWRRDDAPEQEQRDDASKQTAHRTESDAKTAGASSSPVGARPTSRFALGVVEVGVVLGLLDALFLGFVCVQVRYLFGSAAWVAATGGLTYAEYARRGFFELSWATALALPLLLALHWLLRADDRLALRVFRALALVQLALLFV